MSDAIQVGSLNDSETTVTHSYSSDQVREAAESSVDFLAGLTIPDVYKYSFPPLYLTLFNIIKEKLKLVRDFSQIAIGLPRGFAKTLFIKLVVVYTVLFTKRQFILILCETEAKAVSIISDIADMLDSHSIKVVFGNWRAGIEIDQQAKKVFGYRGRNIILKGVGAGTSIRGVTEKNRRPDFMVFDDIQSREDAESAVLSDKLMVWMLGTAMKTKNPEGCLFLFVANMYPFEGSILRKLRSNPNWIKFIVGGILADGTSLWEELQPIAQLLREYENDKQAGHPEIFYSEVLNDPNVAINRQIDISKIPSYPYEDDDVCSGKFIIIDPSNDKRTSDYAAIGCIAIYEGKPAVLEIAEGRYSPGELIKIAIKMAFKHNCSYIIVEGVAYQYSLLYWFENTFRELGIEGLQVRDIYPGIKSKNTRIVNMFPMLTSGDILLHPSARPAVFNELTQFNVLKTDNKDNVLDLLTYGHKVIEEYGAQIVSSTYISSPEQSQEVVFYNSPF